MKLSLKLKLSGALALLFIALYTLKPIQAQAPSTTLDLTENNSVSVANEQQKTPPLTPSIQNNASPQPSQLGVFENFAPDTPKNLTTLSQGAMLGLLSSTTCILAGVDPLQKEGKCIGVNPETGLLGYVEQRGGVATVMGGLIGGTMNIPISSGDYATYALSNFGITERAYAQNFQNGVGFDNLRPLLNVWTRFRDIAYLTFVLAFTVIGLAIILRVKVDARTVMTIQNQIPKIIIALVLVTFSYAIAGFMIDVMYALMYLIILTFTNINPVSFNAEANIFSVINKTFNTGWPSLTGINEQTGLLAVEGTAGRLYNSGIFGISWHVSEALASAFTSLTVDFIDSTIGTLFKSLFIITKPLEIGCSAIGFVGKFTLLDKIPKIGGFFGGNSCDFAKTFAELVITTVFTILAFVVVLVAIIFNLFRVWFTLIKSFMYVLVDTMVAPLWITAGVFPGSKLTFSTWIKHLAGHLSVFPTTFAVILLGKTMMDGIVTGGSFFSPPLIGDAFAGNSALAALVGFGFILSLHGILDRVRKAIGALDFGLTDVKAGFGAGRTVASAGINAQFNRGVEYKGTTPTEGGRTKTFIKSLGLMR